MTRWSIIALIALATPVGANAKVNFKANQDACGCRDCSCKASQRRHSVGLLYVHGIAEVSLSYDDLPEFTQIFWDGHMQEDELITRRRFRIVDVLAAMGIPLHDIEYIGLRGAGEKDAVVDLVALRNRPNSLSYEYSQSIAGKTNIHWHGRQPFYGKVDGLHGMSVRTKSKSRSLRLKRQARFHERRKSQALAWSIRATKRNPKLASRKARQTQTKKYNTPSSSWGIRGTTQGGSQ